MESAEESELVQQLKELGFKGQKLKEDLSVLLRMDLINFTLVHKVSYDYERVGFGLYFEKERGTGKYRLQRYTATFQKEPTLIYDVFNGVEVSQLEARMRSVDWSSEQHLLSTTIRSIIEDIQKLGADNDTEGRNMADALCIKYWTDTPYEVPGLTALKEQLEFTQIFDPSTYGVLHANLAYHYLRGSADDLFSLAGSIGLNNEQAISQALSQNIGAFTYTMTKYFPEGRVEYTVPIIQLDKQFGIGHYFGLYTPYKEMRHGVHGGVNSQNLEERMAAIDWQSEHNYVQEEGQYLFNLPIYKIIEDIKTLARSAAGMELANSLQLKYWSGVPIFKGFISSEARQQFENMPKRQAVFPIYVHARSAYNLFCNRSAAKENDNYSTPLEWIKLDPEKTDAQGNCIIVPAGSYSDAQIELDLRMLPLSGARHIDIYNLKSLLLRGDLQDIILTNGEKVLLEAQPDQQTIIVYDEEKKIIPINLKFAPDWLPSGHKTQQILPGILQMQQKNKGKHKNL